MAVTLKTTYLEDISYIRLNKSNRKGIAELVGGKVEDHDDGTFFVVFDGIVNRQKRWLVIHRGDFVFRTGKSKRFQVASREKFLKRFPELKGIV